MTKNYKLILLIYTVLLVFGILVVFVFDINCIFKSIFHIPCPGCGLTRGFRQLLNLNLIECEKYNILTIPIFLFLLSSLIIFIYDMIVKNNYLEKFLNFFRKHYIIMLIIVLISFFINLIKYI